MSDDDSNDVVMVESTGNVSDSTDGALAQKETRPLMKLFQRLISNDNKQNTILTNAQIVSILLKEFDIDIVTLHELEVDIYLTVVKRPCGSKEVCCPHGYKVEYQPPNTNQQWTHEFETNDDDDDDYDLRFM